MPPFNPVELTMEQNRQSLNTSSFIFPQDIGPYGMLMVFKDYRFQERRDLIDRQPTPSISSSILLPLPRNLVDNSSVSLNKSDLGTFGEVIAKSMSNKDNSLTAMRDAAASLFPSGSTVANEIRNLVANGGSGLSADVTSQLNFLSRRLLSNIGDPSAFNIGAGSVVNPKQALSFDGLPLKRHSFDWILAPRSPGESEVLRQVIRTLKRHMLPGFQNINLGGTSVIPRAFLKFPSMVDIFFMGFEAGFFYHFKTCMIETITTSYTPNGVSILKGGKPAAVELSIAFAETDIHVSADYGGEGDSTETDTAGFEFSSSSSSGGNPQ